MRALGLVLLSTPFVLAAYAYVGYPLLAWVLGLTRARSRARHHGTPLDWPFVTITLPVYNEALIIRQKLEELLALDYPADRRHILVISDASTDATDSIVAEFASTGVELLRLDRRSGKSAAENAAGSRIRGEIVVNTDAGVRIPHGALKMLVRAFDDPTVGVVSGRDVSTGALSREANAGESGYVGYEMWLRGMETRLGSIVGASGCFYGIRASIYDSQFPEALSRDFASALMARRQGYRAVSVQDAICYVPRTSGLAAEYRRKVRTMARGLNTLWHMRELLDPRRYGTFAFMLISHKLCRWLVYLALPLAFAGVALLGVGDPLGRKLMPFVTVGAITAAFVGVVALRWPAERHLPRVLSWPAFLVTSSAAGVVAWLRVLRGGRQPIWEPTRRCA